MPCYKNCIKLLPIVTILLYLTAIYKYFTSSFIRIATYYNTNFNVYNIVIDAIDDDEFVFLLFVYVVEIFVKDN